MEAWHVIQCKARQEERAVQQLENQQLEVFYPSIDVERIRAGRRQSRREALFPGYLFVRFDPQFFSLTTLQSTRGVARLIRLGGKPACVADALIAQLRERCSLSLGHPQLYAQTPSRGDPVRITAGPFAGFDALFAEVDGDKRALLMLDLLGQQQLLCVDNSGYEWRR